MKTNEQVTVEMAMVEAKTVYAYRAVRYRLCEAGLQVVVFNGLSVETTRMVVLSYTPDVVNRIVWNMPREYRENIEVRTVTATINE